MFTLVLELINKELNFTADVLIYRTVYIHKIWVLTAFLLFTQLFTAVFTFVLELIDKELSFTADVLIYHIVCLHKIWVVTVLLLFTQLFTAVFTLVPLYPSTLVQINKELNFFAEELIYRIVYSHNIWVVTALLLFTQLFTAVFTLVPSYPSTLVQINKELNFTADVLIYRIVYSHNIWVVTALLLFTQLFTVVFTLVSFYPSTLVQIDKELNFTTEVLIYRIVYLHKIWVVTVLLLFTQLFTVVFTLVPLYRLIRSWTSLQTC